MDPGRTPRSRSRPPRGRRDGLGEREFHRRLGVRGLAHGRTPVLRARTTARTRGDPAVHRAADDRRAARTGLRCALRAGLGALHPAVHDDAAGRPEGAPAVAVTTGRSDDEVVVGAGAGSATPSRAGVTMMM